MLYWRWHESGKYLALTNFNVLVTTYCLLMSGDTYTCQFDRLALAQDYILARNPSYKSGMAAFEANFNVLVTTYRQSGD